MNIKDNVFVYDCYAYMGAYVLDCWCLQKLEKNIGCFGTGVMDVCGLLCVCAGKGTWDLWKRMQAANH